MKVFCIDFETYYSQTFSLTKMTTEAYIRSPEFEVIGFAIQCSSRQEEGGAPHWYSGTKAYLKGVLDKYDLSNNLVIAHNAMFDVAILSFVFDIKPSKKKAKEEIIFLKINKHNAYTESNRLKHSLPHPLENTNTNWVKPGFKVLYETHGDCNYGD